jgi:hypothetical protein
VEVHVRDYGFTPTQQDHLWQQWRDGHSLRSIARTLNAPMQHVRRFLTQTGGIRHRPPQRAKRHLTIHEREEISEDVPRSVELRWRPDAHQAALTV